MDKLWTPIFAFMVFAVAFGLGDIVANRTKSLISSIIVGSSIFLLGYVTKIVPVDALASTGLVTFFGAIGLALLVANLGTLMNLGQLIKEWKTVIIGLVGLVGLGIVGFTVIVAIFGKTVALTGVVPLSGGLVAAMLTANAANAAGRSDMAAFATMVLAFQMFVGLPISAFCLKKEAKRLLGLKGQGKLETESLKTKEFNLRILPKMPEWALSPSVVLAKLAIVLVVGKFLSDLTIVNGQPIIHPFVAYLLLGIIATEIGFLEKQSFNVAKSAGFMMAGIMILLPGNFASVTLSSLAQMIVPLVVILVIGATGIAVFALLAGKLLKISPYMAVSIGLTALLAYPATQIVTEEVVRTLDASDEDKQFVMDQLLPKQLVGGFVTVTVASVVFAGIIVPFIPF